jgi:hypothetical protein
VEAINSEKFKEILKYTKWSTFQTDWRMLINFRKDFWLEFTVKEPIVERILDPKIILIKGRK